MEPNQINWWLVKKGLIELYRLSKASEPVTKEENFEDLKYFDDFTKPRRTKRKKDR